MGDAYVVTLPKSGNLYFLSQPYAKHAASVARYEASDKIAQASPATPVLVKGNRLIYVAPPNMAEPNGEWGRFQYKVQDSAGEFSHIGTVVLVPASKKLAASDFAINHDQWVIRGGSSTAEVKYEVSKSGSLSQFIHATEDSINVRSGLSDANRWNFCAPHKYFGNFELAYGGTLGFTLGSFSGDFTTLNQDRDVVTLECSTCNLGNGMRFVMRDTPFDGSQQDFKFGLTETAGWKKDPKNVVIKEWPQPTECEMVEMLSSLSEFCILGDHTVWYESVGLDNVAITAGDAGAVSRSCLCTHPGTGCYS